MTTTIATSQRTNLAEMDERFVDMLRGSTNSLGRTEEVVELVLADRDRVDEVYDLFFQPDEWVRMRAASVSKRLWRADSELFGPFVARWVEEVSQIDQASTQWTFANMCDECDDLLTNDERKWAANRAKKPQSFYEASVGTGPIKGTGPMRGV